MRLISRSSPRGIALIIVLVVIMVLGILAGGFAYSMKVETKLARNASLDSELEWMGRSGVELARYVLAVGSQTPQGGGGAFDALNQKWAGGPGDTNDPSSQIPLDNYELGNGTLAVKIVDLDRKFNINVANEVILRQGLTLIGVDAAAFPTIVDSVLDWIDADDDTHLSGTESDDYQSNPNPGYPPYRAKNGPIDDLSELLFVRGVTPGLYYGSSGLSQSPVAMRPRSAGRSAVDEPLYEIGLIDLFTPLSSRLLNVNTASVKSLQIIPEIDENVAQAIITARAGPDGAEGNEDDTPFRSVAEMARVPGMNPNAVAQLGRFYTVRSQMFEVKVTARVGSYTREFTALLARSSRDIQILNFFWK